MTYSMEKVLADAKKLVNRLKDHDVAADHVISQAQTLQRRVEGMRQYKEDSLKQLMEMNRHNPTPNTFNGLGIQENSQIGQLQRENRELQQCLEEHQSALELIMSKYREQIFNLISTDSVSTPTATAINNEKFEKSKEIQEKIDKICEMVGVMRTAARMDDETVSHDSSTLAQLRMENQTLRELLNISTADWSHLLSTDSRRNSMDQGGGGKAVQKAELRNFRSPKAQDSRRFSSTDKTRCDSYGLDNAGSEGAGLETQEICGPRSANSNSANASLVEKNMTDSLAKEELGSCSSSTETLNERQNFEGESDEEVFRVDDVLSDFDRSLDSSIIECLANDGRRSGSIENPRVNGVLDITLTSPCVTEEGEVSGSKDTKAESKLNAENLKNLDQTDSELRKEVADDGSRANFSQNNQTDCDAVVLTDRPLEGNSGDSFAVIDTLSCKNNKVDVKDSLLKCAGDCEK